MANVWRKMCGLMRLSVIPARLRIRAKSRVMPLMVIGVRVSERKRRSSPALPHWANFTRWSTGHQQAFKLLWLDGTDEGLPHFGEGHAIKGVALDGFAAHQPVEEGARRAGVGLDRALGAHLPAAGWRFTQVSEP